MISQNKGNKVELSLQDIVGKGYADFWNCTDRYRVVKGSRGSKKSKTTALNLIWRMLEYPLANVLVVRRYQNTLRDSCYSDLLWAIDRLHQNDNFDCTVSPLSITKKDTGQKILFRGLDEGTKITSISVPHGVLCWVWIEEAYEIFNENDFNKLDLSIRGELPDGYFKQITLTFNPWSANSWLKKRFFDSKRPNIFTKTTTWECNEWLDDSDRDLFLDMKERNPRRYKVEGEGDWGIAEGLIFDKVRQEVFDIEEIRRISGIISAHGLDFGFTDPNALISMFINEKTMQVYIFDEWYKRNVTNKIIANHIKESGYASEVIICDSAEPKSIQELCDEGIRAEGSRKGPDSVNHGIQLLQNYEIIVHPRCSDFWTEITNYCWALDRAGKPTDKPDHEFSHGPDALRYGFAKAVQPRTFSFD